MRSFTILLIGYVSVQASGAVINVPGDHLTIQAAIDAAIGGDEVVVAPGHYPEAIDLLGKAIVVRSTDPGDPAVVAATIIDATGLDTSVVSCVSEEGPDTVIDGFTITGGTGRPHPVVLIENHGGGMFIIGSSPTVSNCTFTGNSVLGGGGIFSMPTGSPTAIVGQGVIVRCTFIGNTASETGGALLFDGEFGIVSHCVFINNFAGGPLGGGAISGGGNIVTNCLFINNSATEVGGAMDNGSFAVTNCTFIGNSAGIAGGAIFAFPFGDPVVTNCIFWNNTAPSDPHIANATSVSFSLVPGGWAGAGTNNIDADPMFIDADGADNILGTEDDDLHLGSGSPCIDAADNTAPGLVGITADFDGNDRFVHDPDTVNTGVGPAPIVDMGAYEFVNTCPADTDDSGAVNVTDLLALLAAWGPCPQPCPSDIDGSGDVNVTDLLALLAAWGACP